MPKKDECVPHWLTVTKTVKDQIPNIVKATKEDIKSAVKKGAKKARKLGKCQRGGEAVSEASKFKKTAEKKLGKDFKELY